MDNIHLQLSKLISEEDKRKPYKDAELGKIFGFDRGYITQIRKKLGIADSRQRLNVTLKEELRDIISQDRNIKIGKLLKILNERGYEVTRYLISSILGDLDYTIGDEQSTDKTINTVNEESESDPFTMLIGHDGSLSSAVKLAKAAVLYPPNGLNTLLVGESGVGKNLLAKTVFEFGRSKSIFSAEAEFVSFNCADYADNPQLLLSVLFGVKKGAYTGADENTQGLIERANRGVLFLDEIHRMPPKGQEILFQIIDSGKYRRLGESDKEREIQVLIIAATTENPEQCLLNTFLRRIPMVIKLPKLVERPIEERIQIIKSYLYSQARRLGKSIRLTRDACYAFLLYEPSGNIGKLLNDIQVCLAKGYLKSLSAKSKEISVDLDMLHEDVQRGMLRINTMRKRVCELVSNDGLLVAEDENEELMSIENEYGSSDKTVYDFIDSRYSDLVSKKLKPNEINDVIGDEIEYRIQSGIDIKNNSIEKSMIIKIIGSHMTSLVERAIESVGDFIESYDTQFFYCIALHMNETIKRVKNKKKIVNPKLAQIKEKYRDEYIAAKNMIDFVSGEIGYELPEEEAGFIAMYLRSYREKKQKPSIGILVITHGHIANELVELGQNLMGKANIRAIEMSLQESPEKVLKNAVEEIKILDQGMGVLLMVDMGSLLTFGPIISEITGVPVKTIKRVEIVLIMEAIRISKRLDTKLDELFNSLTKTTAGSEPDVRKERKKNLKPLIITTCITGQGTSIYLKEMLDRTLEGVNFEIVALGVLSKEGLLNRIRSLKQQYNIICVIGTINPEIPDIRFIPINEVVNGNIKEEIQKIYSSSIVNDAFMIDKDLMLVKKSVEDRGEAIELLCGCMKESGYVTEKYINEVWNREDMGPTCMNDITEKGIAIIHSATSKEVIKNGFAVLKLEQPVKWQLIDVDLIFLIAVNTFSSDFPELFNEKVLRNEHIMSSIRNCKGQSELIKLLEKNI